MDAVEKRGRLRLNDPFCRSGLIVHIAVTLALVAMFLGTFCLNYNPNVFEGSHYVSHLSHYHNTDQYADLADALLEGRLNLDLPVSDALAQLDDPYNAQERIAAGEEDQPIFWDHAYYQGAYYTYFGVIPAVLVYAPFRLMTGMRLSTPYAIAFIGVLAIGAFSMLVRRIGMRYFRDSVTTLSLAVCMLAMFAGGNFVYLAFVARFYSVPIASSLFFTALGLWFWLGAARGADGRVADECGSDDKQLSLGMLAVGSLCMACNLGCRPQFILASFLAFFIFKRELFVTRQLFSRKGVGATVAALIPYVFVIIPLLAYNYARFGSPLDFGSNYNLTGFNMVEYTQRKLLTAALMATYLFQPPSFTSEFPFMANTVVEYPELGWAPNEPFFGGFFLLKPIMMAALLLPLSRSCLKDRGLVPLVVACLVFAAIVLFVDTRIAGITQRYFSDFGFYVAVVSCFSMLAFQCQHGRSTSRYRIGVALVSIALVLTFAFGALSLFSPHRYDSIAALNPDLYERVASLF